MVAMKKLLISATLFFTVGSLCAQTGVGRVLMLRPDAFPPTQETVSGKALTMATTVEEMASWDRYPTYETYLAMMQRWAIDYPGLCTIDTIGTSVQGRLILAAHIMGSNAYQQVRPQFFYSSTIHGDEVTGYVMMLRLIDTLLSSYGTSQRLTELVNTTDIYINPLANPDGTYYHGNHTVQGSRRYNADGIDLNRNYPDPFGGSAKNLPQENEAMIDYVSAHQFRLSANLHGGAEVMNYPWDCFTSIQNPHPAASWWKEVCQRFVDTARAISNSHFRDVNTSGVIAGGDWYVIHGGRQDYMNYYHNCLEVTMEISSVKTLSTTQLCEYWRFLSPSLINYIAEIHTAPLLGVDEVVSQQEPMLDIRPNPTGDMVWFSCPTKGGVELYDAQGRRLQLLPQGTQSVSLAGLPQGVYLLRSGSATAKVIKR